MPCALIALGSNLGDRQGALDRAVGLLEITPGIDSVRSSGWHATLAVGGPTGQPEFMNGAAVVLTSLSPQDLAQRLTEIEAELGRRRGQRWGPRTIDLDLLLYDGLTLSGPLKLPHPRMAFRRFVLEPAADVAGEMVHPTIGWTIERLRDHLRAARDYVPISGAVFDKTHRLAQAAAGATGWELIQFPGAGEVTEHAGSPSFTKPRTIEFLREQAELVLGAFEQRGPVRAISSFWVEDLLAIGDVLWPGELDEAAAAIQRQMIPPKLLVVYDTESRQTDGNAGAADLWNRFQAARRQRAGRMGIGPVLWLSTEDPATAESELVAAIQSMEPRRRTL